MIAVPVAVTVPNWELLKRVTYERFGRNICASLDNTRSKLTGNLAEYIGTLSEFSVSNSNYLESLRDAGSLLDHAMISMLCEVPDALILPLVTKMNLSILKPEDLHEDLIIITGSLSEWRTAIINLGSVLLSKDCHHACLVFLQVFDSLGLSHIFDNYSRKATGRGGLLLTLK